MIDRGLSQFLIGLQADEHVFVASLDVLLTADEALLATQVLDEFEENNRERLPGTAPPFLSDVGIWAAVKFYRACQFLVYRDVSPQAVETELSVACPISGTAASLHYSVDLTWRFLPDLLKLARGISPDDPLVICLQRWAVEWPMSSVGVPNVTNVDVSAFIQDPCLRSEYVDRIMARRDLNRLQDLRVRDAVREAVGAFPDLAPDLIAVLKESDNSRSMIVSDS